MEEKDEKIEKLNCFTQITVTEQQNYCVALFYENRLAKISILAIPFEKLSKNLETMMSSQMIKKDNNEVLRRNMKRLVFLQTTGRNE